MSSMSHQANLQILVLKCFLPLRWRFQQRSCWGDLVKVTVKPCYWESNDVRDASGFRSLNLDGN